MLRLVAVHGTMASVMVVMVMVMVVKMVVAMPDGGGDGDGGDGNDDAVHIQQDALHRHLEIMNLKAQNGRSQSGSWARGRRNLAVIALRAITIQPLQILDAFLTFARIMRAQSKPTRTLQAHGMTRPEGRGGRCGARGTGQAPSTNL